MNDDQIENSTEFTDKSGRPIYVGDILQLRLGKFAKTGGPSQVRVIRFGKKIQIVDASQSEYPYGGRNLTKQTTEIAVVIQSDVHAG